MSSELFDNYECSICLDSISSISDENKKLPCNHIFHKECISKWKVNTCSCCRSIIVKPNINHNKGSIDENDILIVMNRTDCRRDIAIIYLKSSNIRDNITLQVENLIFYVKDQHLTDTQDYDSYFTKSDIHLVMEQACILDDYSRAMVIQSLINNSDLVNAIMELTA